MSTPEFAENHNPPVTLHCQAGDHDWLRPSQRGRRPLNCPEHQPAPAEREATASAPKNSNGTVTLHCEAGDHSWKRESKRGVRPRNCPEHQPAPAERPTAASQREIPLPELRAEIERTQQPMSVVTAFMLAGIEVPLRDSTDNAGWNFRQDKALKDHYRWSTQHTEEIEAVI